MRSANPAVRRRIIGRHLAIQGKSNAVPARINVCIGLFILPVVSERIAAGFHVRCIEVIAVVIHDDNRRDIAQERLLPSRIVRDAKVQVQTPKQSG
ncbi:hypothetical protein D3C76_1254530 [compost metagenome]